jgi:NAD+ kinase
LANPNQLAGAVPTRVGLVAHPTRDIEAPLTALRHWAERHETDLVQVPASCRQQRVAPEGEAQECELIVSIGGDGTALAALRAGAAVQRPVVSVACGSLGVLSSVPGDGIADAMERFGRRDWTPRSLPALQVAQETGPPVFALNDIAIVRAGPGQLRLRLEVDGSLLARIAGDGCIVSTPTGSGAYALAAGGPLLTPTLEAFVVMPLPTHGGECPPVVAGAGSTVRIAVMQSHTGTRFEVDGQTADELTGPITVSFRPDVATVVTFPDQPAFLAVLRDRRIIADSPRILAEDAWR